MKYWLLFIIPISLFGQNKRQELENLMSKASVPGLALVYVKNGAIAESYYLGVRSNDNHLPVDSGTIFAAASLSKCVFAYGLLQLVDQGIINLDSPLVRYVNYKDIVHDPRHKIVTVREVLSHTSGLPNWRNGSKLDFQYDPGKQFRYSGEGFVWLSKAMDTLTGHPTGEWMQGQVFKKLGMNNSSYLWQDRFDRNFAQPHNEFGKTRSKYFPREANVAHSLQTTANDYGRFLLALLNRKGLKPNTFQDVYHAQPHSEFSDYGGKLAWGLGLGYGQSDHGDYFWQWGDNGTYKAFLIGFPGRKEGLVYFTNSSNGLSITSDLLKLFFDWNGLALKWLKYPGYQDPSFQFNQRLAGMPVQEAIRPFLVADGSHQDTSDLDLDFSSDMVSLLVDQKRWEEAKWLANLNVKTYPSSSEAYGGLAMACLRAGDRNGAADACMKCYALDSTRKIVKQTASRLMGNTDTGSGILQVFKLSYYPNACDVQVAGEFNDWNDFSLPMKWEDGAWTISLWLKPGKYEYKYIVDGIWISDPHNKLVNIERDLNSIIEVKH